MLECALDSTLSQLEHDTTRPDLQRPKFSVFKFRSLKWRLGNVLIPATLHRHVEEGTASFVEGLVEE